MPSSSVEGSRCNAEDVEIALGAVPLTYIPYITTEEEQDRVRRRFYLTFLLFVAAMVCIAVVTHYQWRPLDELILEVAVRWGFQDIVSALGGAVRP